MGNRQFNPFENHGGSNRIQEMQQWSSNRDSVFAGLQGVPSRDNRITNISAPELPLVPNISIVTGNKSVDGNAIRAHVDREIAQMRDGLNLVARRFESPDVRKWHPVAVNRLADAPPYHDWYEDEEQGAERIRKGMPPREVPRNRSRQNGAQQSRAQQSGAQQAEAPQYGAQESDEQQSGSGQSYEPQYGSQSSDGSAGHTGSNRGDSGSVKTDSTQRSYPPDDTPIATGDLTDLTIEGPPTISAQTIDAVLAAHDSPVEGYGQEIFDRCVEAGIDPAIALAFFACESTFGTDGIAVDTKSWGNIRSTNGSGIDGFESYPSYMDGLQDWIRLMKDLYVAPPEEGGFGFTTADEALTKYAPPSENDTEGYANKVTALVSEWRSEEAARPDDGTEKLTDVVDRAREGIGTAGGIAKDALQKMFFTQFRNPEWNNFDGALDSSSNCGPASFAMALRLLGVQPGAANLYGNPNPLVSEVRTLMTGYDNPHEYTDIGQVIPVAKNLGLTTSLVGGIGDIDRALDAGEPVVLGGDPIAYNRGMPGDEYAMNTDGSVYTGGHVITVVERNEDGTYVVMDPAYKGGILTLSQNQLAGYMAPFGQGAGVALGKSSFL